MVDGSAAGKAEGRWTEAAAVEEVEEEEKRR